MSTIHVNQINEVMNCHKSVSEELYVGLCGTLFCGSDRYPVVITEVLSPKCVRVSHLENFDYENNLMSDDNGNEFIQKMNSYIRINDEKTKIEGVGSIYKLRKNNRWIREGQDLWSTGAVHFGKADYYLDPSF